MQRLYYGSGPMHTPADFVAHFSALGDTLTSVPGTPSGIILYRGNSGDNTVMAIFNNLDICKHVVASIAK